MPRRRDCVRYLTCTRRAAPSVTRKRRAQHGILVAQLPLQAPCQRHR